MLDQLIAYAREIDEKLAAGTSLNEIRLTSYDRREAGENVPYLATLNATGSRNKYTVTELTAQPTKAQTDLYAFFAQKAPGSALPRYIFRVTAAGVEFTERLGKGKDNVRPLYRREDPAQAAPSFPRGLREFEASLDNPEEAEIRFMGRKNATPVLDNLLTTTQVASLLGIDRSSVCRLIASGTLKATRVGARGLLVRRADAEAARDRPGPGNPNWSKKNTLENSFTVTRAGTSPSPTLFAPNPLRYR